MERTCGRGETKSQKNFPVVPRQSPRDHGEKLVQAGIINRKGFPTALLERFCQFRATFGILCQSRGDHGPEVDGRVRVPSTKRENRHKIFLQLGLLPVASFTGRRLWKPITPLSEKELPGDDVVASDRWRFDAINALLSLVFLASHSRYFTALTAASRIATSLLCFRRCAQRHGRHEV